MWGTDRARQQRNMCGTHTVWEWMQLLSTSQNCSKKITFSSACPGHPIAEYCEPLAICFRARITPLLVIHSACLMLNLCEVRSRAQRAGGKGMTISFLRILSGLTGFVLLAMPASAAARDHRGPTYQAPPHATGQPVAVRMAPPVTVRPASFVETHRSRPAHAPRNLQSAAQIHATANARTATERASGSANNWRSRATACPRCAAAASGAVSGVVDQYRLRRRRGAAAAQMALASRGRPRRLSGASLRRGRRRLPASPAVSLRRGR